MATRIVTKVKRLSSPWSSYPSWIVNVYEDGENLNLFQKTFPTKTKASRYASVIKKRLMRELREKERRIQKDYALAKRRARQGNPEEVMGGDISDGFIPCSAVKIEGDTITVVTEGRQENRGVPRGWKAVARKRVPNISQGFYSSTGFHPIRSSPDYDPDRAGDYYSQRTAPKKKKKPAKRKAAKKKPAKRATKRKR